LLVTNLKQVLILRTAPTIRITRRLNTSYPSHLSRGYTSQRQSLKRRSRRASSDSEFPARGNFWEDPFTRVAYRNPRSKVKYRSRRPDKGLMTSCSINA